MNDPNTELLRLMANALGDLCDHLVFVGGCATALLITDRAAPSVRPTRDVDAVAAVTSFAEYQRLGRDLLDRGFMQTLASGDPPYRWRNAGMLLDIMPADDRIPGFSSRWYAAVLASAVTVPLEPGPTIRLVTPACFLATKLEAFHDRGRHDYLASHDLEDVLSVVDGRPEIVAEIRHAEPALRRFVADAFERLLAEPGFLEVLPGLILDSGPTGRAELVAGRLRSIIAAADEAM